MMGLIEGLLVRSKAVPTEAERQRRLQEVFRETARSPGYLSNSDIWLIITGTIQQSGRERFLTSDIVSGIVEQYRATHHLGNIPVAELTQGMGIDGLRKDSFLNRVAFNYDHELTGSKRWEEAIEELSQHGRESVDWDDPDFITVDRLIHYELARLQGNRSIGERSVYNEGQEVGKNFYITGSEPTLAEEISYGVVQLIPPLWPLLAFGGPSTSGGWRDFWYVRNLYEREVFPLMNPDQLIKANRSDYRGIRSYFPPPELVRVSHLPK